MWIRQAILVLLLVTGPASAQEAGPTPTETPSERSINDLSLGQVRSPVLTIDPERLFAESLFGERVASDLRVQAEALDAENRQIEAMLTGEERDLTLLRPTMPVEEFRVVAQIFDEKVQGMRDAQDAKERNLQQAANTARDTFLAAATPVLASIMIDSGAAVILDRRSVFLGVGVVDITDRAIAAVNEELGDGSSITSQTQGGDATSPVEEGSP
jgi:Skp family chaperone for outer membrane proteins